jgi:hypothetical protein
VGVRYTANVGRMTAAVVIPASTPSRATGGVCRVAGFPGTLAVPTSVPDVPRVPKLAAQGYYPSLAARYMRPQVWSLVAPYPMRPPLKRTRDRISPVPAVTPKHSVPLAQKPRPTIGPTVMYNPRPFIAWPVRGRRGTYG